VRFFRNAVDKAMLDYVPKKNFLFIFLVDKINKYKQIRIDQYKQNNKN